MDRQIIVYEPNEQTKMEVKTDGETVWLTQGQMCRLFGRERSVITKHITTYSRKANHPRRVLCKFCTKPPNSKKCRFWRICYNTRRTNVQGSSLKTCHNL